MNDSFSKIISRLRVYVFIYLNDIYLLSKNDRSNSENRWEKHIVICKGIGKVIKVLNYLMIREIVSLRVLLDIYSF